MSTTTNQSCTESETGDPRVLRTRKLLQDAFRSLVHEKHYSEISVQDIAERATVNRATFYAHYLDKQDLADTVLKTDLKHAIVKRFAERPDLTRETLVQFAAAVFEFVAAFHQCAGPAAATQACDGSALQEGLVQIIEGWLSESKSHQTVFPGSSKETLAIVFSSSFLGGAQRWVRSDPRRPAAKVCEEIVAVLMPMSRTN